MTLRTSAPRATQRWGILWAVVATFTLVFGALVANAANVTGSNFEIDTDANLIVNGASPAIDWLAGGTGTAMRAGVITQPDKASGSGDDSFGQGSKEDTAVPTVVSGSIPPNKSDLKNFGVYTESNANGDFLNLFWTRVQDPSGTTNMDFEFNHNKCDPDNTTGNVCSANGVTPTRTSGDLLIQYDLSNGGTNATITKRTWNGSSWGPAVALDADEATGTINSSAIAAANSGGLGSLSPRTFGEASINLDTIFSGGGCEAFGSAYLKSRSSDTFSSALKDFIAPKSTNISNCGSITIIKDAVPNALQDFAYTTTGTGLSGFSLDNDAGVTGGDATLSDTKVFSSVGAGTYTVTEGTVSGWTLASITCSSASGVGDVPTRKATITLAAKENITCTFVNNQDLANPSATSTPKVIPQDTVTVSGFDNTGSLDGTMTVSLYASGDTGCTGSPVYTDTFTLTSNGAKVTDNTGVAATDGYTITSSGIYRWKVDYAGDSRNNDFHIACGVELINVTLTGNTP
jgi:hypothetical protein